MADSSFVIVSKIDKPTEFHIHQGVKGTNGNVVVPFVFAVWANAGDARQIARLAANGQRNMRIIRLPHYSPARDQWAAGAYRANIDRNVNS